VSRYQVIFAGFFVGAIVAKAHWYSIKTLHDDIPTLASLLGMSQENLSTLLEATRSGLGSLRKDGKSSFKRQNLLAF
jgi:hypothetical protein